MTKWQLCRGELRSPKIRTNPTANRNLCRGASRSARQSLMKLCGTLKAASPTICESNLYCAKFFGTTLKVVPYTCRGGSLCPPEHSWISNKPNGETQLVGADARPSKSEFRTNPTAGVEARHYTSITKPAQTKNGKQPSSCFPFIFALFCPVNNPPTRDTNRTAASNAESASRLRPAHTAHTLSAMCRGTRQPAPASGRCPRANPV